MSREDFCHVRNRVKKLIKESKKRYFCKKFAEVKGDMRRTGSVINNVTHPNSNKKRGNIDKLIGPDGPITDSLKIANAMNNYFSNVGSKIASSFHNRVLREVLLSRAIIYFNIYIINWIMERMYCQFSWISKKVSIQLTIIFCCGSYIIMVSGALSMIG